MSGPLVVTVIALVLSLFNSALEAIRLWDWFRFRRPALRVNRAELQVKQYDDSWGTFAAEPLHVRVRGSRERISITRIEARIEETPGGRGLGITDERSLTLEPRLWIDLHIAWGGLGLPGSAPSTLSGRVILSNPEDVYTGAFVLQLSKDGLRYSLEEDELLTYLRRTRWQQTALQRVVERIRRAVRRARRT